MADDDEAHHRAVQEIANRQRSSIAPFGVPPSSVTPPKPRPATESVPDPRTWQPQFDQLRPRPNPAALEPASTWVPSPPHGDPEAPSTIVRSESPLVLRVTPAAVVTKQEQPDHPRSHISPGVQDPPTEPASSLRGAIDGELGKDADGSPQPDVLDPQTGLAIPAETPADVELLVASVFGSRWGHGVLDQSLAPVRVEERDGTIVLASEHDGPLLSAEADFNAWREPVIDHVKELLAGDCRQGTNHSRLRDRLLALGSLLPGAVSAVKERQFRIGYEVERLQGLLAAYQSGGDDMPMLNAAVLEDVKRLLLALKMGVDKLERWAEFRRLAVNDAMKVEDVDLPVVSEALEQMAATMEQQPKYFDPKLPSTFRFLSEAVRDPIGATKTVVFGAVMSAENLIKFLGTRALGIVTRAVDAVESHISKVVAISLISGFSVTAAQLSGALPAGWTWLKPLLEAIAKAALG